MPHDRPDGGEDGAGLRWLFLDLNSYFASVEQQMNPGLRGRPVIVRPAESEHTCAIAASHEARAFGIKTGTRVSDARKLCPGLAVIDARPDVYVTVHKAIMREIGHHIPIWKIGSIDEAACELTGPDRLERNAVALARRIQAGIRDNVGQCLRSSVGLAPSRFLAKTASGMKKPNGVTVLRADRLPGPLLGLAVSKFPGIGPRMRARLLAAGVTDTASLWSLPPGEMRALWGSIEGERVWRGLHGLDSAPPPERPLASISHSHVLAKPMRTPEGARMVARRLTVKCGARLRRLDLTGAGFTLHVDLGGVDGWRASGLHAVMDPTCDTFVLLAVLDGLWRRIERRLPSAPLSHVGVGIHRLKPLSGFAPDLFGWVPDRDGDGPARSLRLSRALDHLNARFGKDTVSIGPKAALPAYVGAKIAFNRIPETEEFWE